MRAEPSPLDWRVQVLEGELYITCSDEIQSVVAHIRTYPDAPQEALANARLIVRAVKSHAVLVAALRELVRAFDATSYRVTDRLDVALCDADTVLAQADGADSEVSHVR